MLKYLNMLPFVFVLVFFRGLFAVSFSPFLLNLFLCLSQLRCCCCCFAAAVLLLAVIFHVNFLPFTRFAVGAFVSFIYYINFTHAYC